MNKLLMAFAAVGAAVAGSSAFATDYWVSPNGTGDYLSRETPGRDLTWLTRNKATTAGDVIHLLEGTHYVTRTTGPGLSPKLLANNVTLIGETDDRSKVVLDAEGKSRGLIVDGAFTGARILNLTIRNGKTDYQGGGICTTHTLYNNYVVSNCVVESCQAKYQGGGANGGIWYDSVIRNCKVTNTIRSLKKSDGYGEVAGSGGGVWGGVLYNCTISGNSSFAAGAGLAGGIAANATTLIPGKAYDCVIKDNYANVGPGGGAGGDDEVMCVLERCWIEHNLTTNHLGGAMDARGGGVALCRVIDCTITNCSANYAGSNVGMGGGAYKSVCSGTILAQNFATGSGGGILGGSCSNCVIRGNRATQNYGGGTYNTRTHNCIVVSNASGKDAAGHSRGYHEGDIVCFNESNWPRTGYGSAICNSEGSDPCVVVNCTVYHNSGSTAALSHTVMTNVLIWGGGNGFCECFCADGQLFLVHGRRYGTGGIGGLQNGYECRFCRRKRRRSAGCRKKRSPRAWAQGEFTLQECGCQPPLDDRSEGCLRYGSHLPRDR